MSTQIRGSTCLHYDSSADSNKALGLISLHVICDLSSLAPYMLRVSIVTQPCLPCPLRFEYDE